MASKFQNRLVGTVILVALGVIILPGLLDGKKKHYEDEFASIPLVPKAGDSQDQENAGQVTQALPAQPPEGASAAINAGAAEAAHAAAQADGEADEGDTATAAPKTESPKATQPKTLTPPAMTEFRQAQQPRQTQTKPVEPKRVEPKKVEPKPVETAKTETRPQTPEKAPAGQSYVVQLGALKNADKVNEVVAKLRLSGYRAYTVPATPVQGQITRVFVGPEANKQNLEASLSSLKSVSGLSGVVRAYSAH
ncbi:cell division protein DedD [Rouxiella badensis]|uniref:cell division protein DedD n=1 Tax=Rouxiella badensis TaxID=1646377 RepID=UPI0028D64E76|nr:cell division protein DedD [Rouxiella badensis]